MSVSSTVASVASTVASTAATASSSGAPEQAGVFEGSNPVEWNPSSPITLFIIQAVIVIAICQILTYPLRLLQQPRVIAEVIGGIILGPSVMMRIPNFKETIFPTASMPVFSNVANLGLIIFLFLVALEVDIRLFSQNWRVALGVSVLGMCLPFGLGCAIAWGIYNQFRVDPADGSTNLSFGVFALFIGTALAITAFPVLCRILTELKLLGTNVGVTVLAAGIGNDVTGWILLALCVALVNNSSGLTALWALLTAIGYALFLAFVVKPPFHWCLRKTGSIENGPTQGMVALTLLMALVSAWFTGIIGVHPIFGAFLLGLICPHDGGFTIKLTEKIEDFISVLFLPLYFALSGLSTDLGLLNDGITWGYVVGIIVVAFAGKIIGGTLGARFFGLFWRESFTIGCLMSCKGLVELIVLNIGLQANILDKKTFTMFVVMALVTTVATTPLTKLLYPYWYQKKVTAYRKGEIEWDGKPLVSESSSAGNSGAAAQTDQLASGFRVRRLLVYLRLDSLPALFTFITLLGNEKKEGAETTRAFEPSAKAQESAVEDADASAASVFPPPARPLEVHGLRLIELTDRTSDVMRVTEGEELSARDPVVNTFRTFSRLNDFAVAARAAVVTTDSFAETLMSQATDVSSDFVLIPWSEYGGIGDDQSVAPTKQSTAERFQSSTQLGFVQKALHTAATTCTAGIFIDNGLGGGLSRESKRPGFPRQESTVSIRSHRSHRSHFDTPVLPAVDKTTRIYLPFFGGIDDRVAVHFVLQLARNPHVVVTIAHFTGFEDGDADDAAPLEETPDDDGPSSKETETGTGVTATATAMTSSVTRSSTADYGTKKVESVTAHDLGLLAAVRKSPPEAVGSRVTVTEVVTTVAAIVVSEARSRAARELGRSKNAGDIVVVGRRHVALDGDGDGASQMVHVIGGTGGNNGELRKTVGVVAEAMITGDVRASVLVIQAGGNAARM